MKVGLIDTLGSRYQRFWGPYLKDLGVQLATPGLPREEAYALGQSSLSAEPPTVQLVLGRVLELARADVIVLPQLTGPEGDPWGEHFAEVLARRVSSLPTLISVPEGGASAAALAADLGTRLTQNPGLVRRALDRHRPLLSPPREGLPELSVPNKRTVAVIGPQVLLAEPYLLGQLPAELDRAGLHAVYGNEVPREMVLERALRAGAGTPAERELVGAMNALEGKSAVRGLVFVVPARSGAWRALAQRVADRARKAALLLEVAPERAEWGELALFAERVTLGAVVRKEGDE